MFLFFSKNKYRTYINPITLFVGVHLFSIILMYGTSIINHRLSVKLYILIVIMIFMYILGTIVGKRQIVFRNCFQSKCIKETNEKRLKKIIIIYSLIFDLFAIYYLLHLNSSYGFQRMLVDLSGLNAAIQNGEFKSGIYTYFTPIGVPLALMILFYLKQFKNKIRCKWLYIIQYILCYIPCISPRRDYLFYIVIVNILYYVTQIGINVKFNRSISKKIRNFCIVGGVLFFGVWIMSYTQQLMNKDTSYDFLIFGINVPKFLKDPVLYIAGNYPYLEKMNCLGELSLSQPLISTFRLIYRYLCPIIGLNVDTNTIFDLPFYDIGYHTEVLFNTAPVLYYAIIEAGMFFGIIFFVMGILSEKAFLAVNQKSTIGKIMLGIFQYSIIVLSFREYKLIFQTYLLMLIYIYIAYKYVDICCVEVKE